jgi:hypothetical protein
MLTSMIISNRNNHDRPDIRATRSDNVMACPVDVEIEKRTSFKSGVTCDKRKTPADQNQGNC